MPELSGESFDAVILCCRLKGNLFFYLMVKRLGKKKKRERLGKTKVPQLVINFGANTLFCIPYTLILAIYLYGR